ncbi:hypothetical protein SLEP1_g10006 [Rubroshorea leprosula]|uniref:PGG domain-containing protein n=1 Tax=Rubroshorea leprosula TaxID=152421 RepID=A0AAV5IEN8_9ROSI|nr:hypothetical protein SLEP1_g10006 [Rubroshorea leprosula]
MDQERQSKSKPEIGVGASDGKKDEITEITEILHCEGWGTGEEDEMIEDSHLVDLRKRICEGDWNAVKQFFDRHPLDTIILSNEGYTALHVAILVGQYEIAEDLIKMMSGIDLEKRTAWYSDGHTALTLVATTGRIGLAKCMVQKNSNLLILANALGYIPVTAACAAGHKDMAYYLYRRTPPEVFLSYFGKYGLDLMRAGIDNKILVQSLSNCGAVKAMFEATKQGIVEFVAELLKITQPLIFTENDYQRNVFMIAIQYRQERIFSLLYGINEEWTAHILNQTDICRNNMLHVAGELAPPPQHARISSPALHMQREEVESIVPEWCKKSKNDNGETPYEVFSKSHKELVDKGEKWMRDMANSFIVVGTLIITITFAAAITLPGGNAQNGFSLNVYGNPSIALRPGRFSPVLTQEVDHFPLHYSYFYCSNDG